MFEWCSIAVMSTSSPSPTRDLPNDWATRFTPSVAPRTKTVSRVLAAPRNARTFSRAPSYSRVATSLRWCTPRWMLAFCAS